MIDHLMCDPAVVLQDVVVDGACGCCDFLRDRLRRVVSSVCFCRWDGEKYKDLVQLVVGYVGQLGAVVLGDDELAAVSVLLGHFLSREYRVTVAKRADVEECDGALALEDLEGWEFACGEGE